MTNRILDPTGRSSLAGSARRAPRSRTLDGLVVGLLENSKQNAALFLDDLGELLVGEHGAQRVVRSTKHQFAAPVPEAQLKELAHECDVVITGVGDCGSCSASAVADGIAFENAGVPTAVVCSDAFRVTADAMAELRGAPGYAYLTTAHPVAILDPAGVRERARALVQDVVAMLTCGPSS